MTTQRFSIDERRKCIRKFRKQLKLSQAEFAALAGIGPSMLSRFELGNRDLSPEAYARVEEALAEAMAQRKLAVQGAGRIVSLASLKDVGPLAPSAEWGNVVSLASLKDMGRPRPPAIQSPEELRRKIAESWQRIADATAETANAELKLAALWAEILGELILGTMTRGELAEMLDNSEHGPIAAEHELNLVQDHLKIIREEIAAAKARLQADKMGTKVNA